MVQYVTAADLLAKLHELGILTVAEGNTLRLFPADRVPPNLVPLLRAHKRALLFLLRPLPGWPPDVPLPVWWPDLAGSLADVLVEAAAHFCQGCRFPVAVRWRPRDGALRWACPRCGLHLGCGPRPGVVSEADFCGAQKLRPRN